MVSAASSLANLFREAGAHFEAANPGTTISFNFAASGVLLQQITRGAPVDLLAVADHDTMDQAEQLGLLLADSRRDFAHNTLVLAARADSALTVGNIRDLTATSVQRIAIGNPNYVPAGRYTRAALEELGSDRDNNLWAALQPVLIPSQSVRQALDYVARGEVDAGFVFATDAQLMSDRVKVVAAVPMLEPIRYPIAVLRGSSRTAAAERFIAYLLSAEGQVLLARYGFDRP